MSVKKSHYLQPTSWNLHFSFQIQRSESSSQILQGFDLDVLQQNQGVDMFLRLWGLRHFDIKSGHFSTIGSSVVFWWIPVTFLLIFQLNSVSSWKLLKGEFILRKARWIFHAFYSQMETCDWCRFLASLAFCRFNLKQQPAAAGNQVNESRVFRPGNQNKKLRSVEELQSVVLILCGFISACDLFHITHRHLILY